MRDATVQMLAQHGMRAAWPEYWRPLIAPGADPRVVEAARSIAFAQDVDAVIRGVRVFHSRPDRVTFLEAADFPVLIVTGEHDRIPRNAEALAASLRHGSFERVEGSGHYVPLERPATLRAILDAFLTPRS